MKSKDKLNLSRCMLCTIIDNLIMWVSSRVRTSHPKLWYLGVLKSLGKNRQQNCSNRDSLQPFNRVYLQNVVIGLWGQEKLIHAELAILASTNLYFLLKFLLFVGVLACQSCCTNGPS